MIKPPKERRKKRQQIKKPAPDCLLKASIMEFCKNLNLEKEKKKFDAKYIFEMKYKILGTKITIPLDKSGISKKGIFPRYLKEIKCDRYKKIYDTYTNGKEGFPTDCKLSYDSRTRHFTFYVPIKRPMKQTNNRKSNVALDPGESIFLTYYSNEEYGKIGDNTRIKIKRLKKKTEYYQSVIDKGISKKGKNINNIQKLKNKLKNTHERITGYVNEIHKKGAKYLCENYERIMIPKFETKPIISRNRIKKENEEIKKIEDLEEAKKKLRILKKQQRMSEEVKYVLNRLSHFTFRKFLMCKAEEYGTKVYMVDEHYTSLSCIKCGKLSKTYVKREKTCDKCGYTINRDIGGSRNIYCKGIVPLKHTIHLMGG